MINFFKVTRGTGCLSIDESVAQHFYALLTPSGAFGHSGHNYSTFLGSTNNNQEPRNVECEYTLDDNRSLEQR
jgi:hypothetical protein